MKIAFDIGGVISKYPHILRPLLAAIHSQLKGPSREEVEIHIISDMHPKDRILYMLGANGFGFIPEINVHSANYAVHGELCKAKLCEELGIAVLVDDFTGYVATGKHLRLLVMPEPTEPYYHDTWKTDGTEGDFGRRKKG